MVLFVGNIAPVAYVVATGLAPFTSSVLNISDITQFFDHVRSSSTLQLIKGKSRDLQELLKDVNQTKASAFNLLLSFGFFLLILTCNQKIYFLLFFC